MTAQILALYTCYFFYLEFATTFLKLQVLKIFALRSKVECSTSYDEHR